MQNARYVVLETAVLVSRPEFWIHGICGLGLEGWYRLFSRL